MQKNYNVWTFYTLKVKRKDVLCNKNIRILFEIKHVGVSRIILIACFRKFLFSYYLFHLQMLEPSQIFLRNSKKNKDFYVCGHNNKNAVARHWHMYIDRVWEKIWIWKNSKSEEGTFLFLLIHILFPWNHYTWLPNLITSTEVYDKL